MVFITEELVRKRAEHNEGEIFSLEELSLHQLDIEKIEHLDKWCRDLKILYLQSNLIPRIENVSRFKKLEYLNLALNNIETIENLEGCEFLKKLDLTVNFVGDLESVENLIDNYHLRELYLTGNPCTEYEGYRDYVIATLPQLKTLDGTEITKSDRIKALQNYKSISKKILAEQEKYFKKREQQRREHAEKSKDRLSMNPDEYWKETSDYTPESRIEAHKYQQEIKKKDEQNKKGAIEEETVAKKPRKYISDDGTPFNCNEPKVEFELVDDDEKITLTVGVFKYMDTSLVDVDVQPKYVRVTLKGKVLQLVLHEEVKCDTSSAQRSQTTGELVVKMPKLNPVVRMNKQNTETEKKIETKKVEEKKKKPELLEVDPSKLVDLKNIVKQNNEKQAAAAKKRAEVKEKENSADFVDDPDVPPLI